MPGRHEWLPIAGLAGTSVNASTTAVITGFPTGTSNRLLFWSSTQ